MAAVSQYLAIRGRDVGPLLQHQDRASLTKYQFWMLTSRALDLFGLKGVKFGTHLFWIGAASIEAAIGYTPSRIRYTGQWRLSVYKIGAILSGFDFDVS